MNGYSLTRMAIVALATSSLAVGSCTFLKPKPDPTRYYVLSPLSQQDAAELRRFLPPGNRELAVGVGPIRFPDYLRKSQLVTRTAPNRLEVSEIDRWAEPPEGEFTRVLGGNLGALLGTTRILPFPWYGSLTTNYRVGVEVIRFESGADGEALLHARWAVYPGEPNKAPLGVHESNLTEPVSGEGPDAAVAALSRVLGRFSAEVAAAIRSVDAAR